MAVNDGVSRKANPSGTFRRELGTRPPRGSAGQNNINATKMRQIKIPVPSLSGQRRFVTEIGALERTIATAQDFLTELNAADMSLCIEAKA